MSAPRPTPQTVLALRDNPLGRGQQFQVKWVNRSEPTWTGVVAFRRDHPALVSAFEQAAQQQPNAQTDTAGQAQQGAEGAIAQPPGDAQLLPAVLVSPQPGGALPSAGQLQLAADGSSSSAQYEVMAELVRQQARELESLRVAAAQQPPTSSPPVESSRFARNQPRPQDLREYEGAAGIKLDEWLQELSLAGELYELNAREITKFATSRLRGAALQWWLALSAAERETMAGAGALATALRSRFQPVTASRLAREQLDRLQQGSRHVNEYIADFQRLRTALPSMAEEDALYAFERGLRRDLVEKLRMQGVSTLSDAIALAARVGGMTAASSSSSAPHTMHPSRAAAAQMEIDHDGSGAASLEERITRSVLNALHTQQGGASSSGMGAKTQTQRGYASDSQRGGGAARGGRGGRFSRAPPPPMVVPGVPEHTVRQRLDAQQCVRCGQEGHRSFACPNAISALGN